MLLWVGLGNPGKKYASTRHNIGIFVLEKLTSHFTIKKKSNYLEYKQNIFPNVKLIFPQTYMNHSGIAVQKACHFYKIKLESLVVFHDEIELPRGQLRYKFGGGHRGHNGLRDIISHMGGNDFHRVCLGVGRPEKPEQTVADFLLEEASLEDLIDVNEVMDILQTNELI